MQQFNVLRHHATLLTVATLILIIHTKKINAKTKIVEELELKEDIRILRKSIALYGPPQRHEKFHLLGPEIKTGDEKMIDQSILQGQPYNLTYKYRSVSQNFSYNEHYQTTKIKKVGDKEVLVVRGQVSQEIPRKNGGCYIRTIGYVSDEQGFSTFLIDITKINQVKVEPVKQQSVQYSSPIVISGHVGNLARVGAG